VYYGGRLVLATTVRSKCEDPELGRAAQAIANAVHAGLYGATEFDAGRLPQTWVVESQQHYAGPRGRGAPSVGDDLVALTTAAGWILGRCAPPGAPVRLVLPAEWKGQAPKEVIQRRAASIVLPACEGAFRPTPADRASHDCWDAVALGLWAGGWT
jgi:hypothetical protein